MKLRLRFVLILAFFTSIILAYDDFLFQKKVWSFWNSEGISSSPLFIQACYHKIRQSSQKAGFTYTHLNSETIKNFITDYDSKIAKIRQKSQQQAIQHFADLIRFYIIHEHGGIWIDIGTILIDEFNWLQHLTLQKSSHLITNRFASQPDVLFFYYNKYQNSAQYFIDSPKTYYNQIPGYEIWFFAAKKNNSLIYQLAVTYSDFTQMSLWNIQQKFKRQNIYMNNLDDLGTYLTANMVVSYVMQKRQFQLDKSLEFFGKRPNVYEEQKVWSLNAMLGPLVWNMKEKVNLMDLFQQPKSYFQEKNIPLHFFVKLVGDWSRIFSQRLRSLQYIAVDKNQTFEQFLETYPKEESCEWWVFLVEGSVLANTFAQLQDFKKLNVLVITIEQYQSWRQFCPKPQLLPQESFLTLVYQTIFFQDYSAKRFERKMQLLAAGNGVEKETVLEKYNVWVGIVWRYFVDCVVVVVGYVGMRWVWRRSKVGGCQVSQASDSTGDESCSFRLVSKLALYCLLFITLLTVTSYTSYSIDLFGTRDQPFPLLLALTFTFLLQHIIQSTTHPLPTLLYSNLHIIIQYWQCTMTLCLMIKDKQWLEFCSITIAAGQIIFRLLQTLPENMLGTQWYDRLLRFNIESRKNNIFRISAIAFLILINLAPNLRHYTIFSSYLICHLPTLALLYLITLYMLIMTNYSKKVYNLETLRLVALGVLVLAIYVLIPYRNVDVTKNQNRIKWTILTLALLSSLYLQIGSTLTLNDAVSRKSLIKYLSMITVAFFASSFIWTSRANNSSFIKTQILIIMAYNYLLSLWMLNQTQDQSKKQQNIQLNSISTAQLQTPAT